MKNRSILCTPLRPASLMLVTAAAVLSGYTANAQGPDPVFSLSDTFDQLLGTPSRLGDANSSEPGLVQEDALSFLRLLHGQNSQNNHYTYDLPQNITGVYEKINASFDFRIQSGTAGLADGFSFMLIPTETFGESGDGPNPTAEEPNVAGTLGVAFDVYPNINNVSAHWDNAQRIEVTAPADATSGLNYRSNQVFNKAQISIERVGNGSNVSVTITHDSLGATPGTPITVFDVAVPNLLPYQNRVQFAGRTGGENLKLDLDNLQVDYSKVFDPASVPAAPAAATGHIYQDFDSSGTSTYQVAQNNLNRPGPKLVAADAGSKGAFLRLTQDGVNDVNNQIAFNRGVDGGTTNKTEVLDFDLRVSSADQPADGLGILFLPTNTQGVAGAGVGSSEEPNLAGALGIGFDVYPNGDPEPGAPSLSLHWNNSKVADISIADKGLDLNEFHHLQVIREPVAGGINVSVIATPDINGAAGAPVTLFDKFFIKGANNYDYRLEFASRTGGANASHDIDNIVTSQVAAPARANTQTNFTNGNGSGWKAYYSGAGKAPELRTDGFTNGQYLRLAHEGDNAQTNSVTFDKQLDGTIGAGANGVRASFDFRMNNDIDPASVPADGFSLMLIPTAIYGDTGPGAMVTTPGFAAENPNVPGVFGVGFDVYRDGVRGNDVTLHWDNQAVGEKVELALNDIDLVAGLFHRANLALSLENGEVFASLTLTPNAFAEDPEPAVTVFDHVLIPGMTSLYDYRVEFAARTGGLNVGVDLDNILVQTVPEPSSALLLSAGIGLLASRRRRRATV